MDADGDSYLLINIVINIYSREMLLLLVGFSLIVCAIFVRVSQKTINSIKN